jgi:formylglycine-generating enzyme required for sulfatase activity
MGSSSNEPGRYDDEGPQHQVSVNSFYMGKYEVTQAEYEQVMGINPSKFKGSNLPVEQITWYDVVEYCNRLSQREGLTPVYQISGSTATCNWNANGYRLPTEAEWEYACRAGTTTAYNTGNTINTNTGWYGDNSNSTTHPVGQKPANAWGLYDMHGNVWEWCWDWFVSYSSRTQTDPRGPTSGSYRVARGGSWFIDKRELRSAYRGYYNPSVRYSILGFRLVRS